MKLRLDVFALVLALFELCLSCEKFVYDSDGNLYPTVMIGHQIWMTQNLNVEVEGSMCYNDDPMNCEKYGRLYTWDAAQKACPKGWHLPSADEFHTLEKSVTLRTYQKIVLKKVNDEALEEGEEAFYNHLRDESWKNGMNTFVFSALPAGMFYDFNHEQKFQDLGEEAYFWTSTDCEHSDASFYFHMSIREASLGGVGLPKTFGFSVRCLKD